MWLRHMPTRPRRCPNRARAPIARSVCHWQSSRESFLNASNAGRQVQNSEGNGRVSLKPVPVLSGPVGIKRSPLSDRSNGANPGNSRVADPRGEPLEHQQIERAVE